MGVVVTEDDGLVDPISLVVADCIVVDGIADSTTALVTELVLEAVVAAVDSKRPHAYLVSPDKISSLPERPSSVARRPYSAQTNLFWVSRHIPSQQSPCLRLCPSSP